MNISKRLKNTLKELYILFLPTNIQEGLVLTFFLLGYGSVAWYIAENYRVIYDNRIPWDAYFSFDNRAIVLTGGGFERHPLANYFFDIIREISLKFSDGAMNQRFRISLAIMSSISMSFSMMYIFKYLRNIILLPNYLALLLVGFISVFSTSILLSFTPETYTYTFLLLTAFNYFTARKIIVQKKFSTFSLCFFGIGIGGLTITNIVKVYLPILFEKKAWNSVKNISNTMLKVGISCIVFILLYLNRLNFDYTKIFQKTTEQYEKFSQPKATPIWDMICSWFFGGNVIFSSYIIRDYKSPKGFEYKALFMDTFTNIGQYALVFILLSLILWSIIKNFSNPLVKILALSFLVDISIHCILKFGLHTSYIYGGHFIFVYPFLIGWLFQYYRKNRLIFPIILSIVCLLTIFISINNYLRWSEFIQFLDTYYKN